MQAIVTTLVRLFTELGDWYTDRWDDFIDLIEEVWDASMDVADMVGVYYNEVLGFYWQFWQDIFLLLCNVFIDIFFIFLSVPVGLLPDMPDGPDSVSIVGQANVYLPVVEAVALTAAWGTVFGLIAAYKLAKFVRGGG